MIRSFVEDQVGALTGRQDVFDQVLAVDGLPDPGRRFTRFFHRQTGEVVKVRGRTPERRFPESQEPFLIPLVDDWLVGIHVDREIEEVRDRKSTRLNSS